MPLSQGGEQWAYGLEPSITTVSLTYDVLIHFYLSALRLVAESYTDCHHRIGLFCTQPVVDAVRVCLLLHRVR